MADEFIKPAPAESRSAHETQVRVRSPRAQARNAELLVAVLAMIAGFIDAYGMITYGVFVSFMSGNTTQTGYQAAEGAFGPASLAALGDPVLCRGSVRRNLARAGRGSLCAKAGVRRGRGRSGRDRRLHAFRLAKRRRRDRSDKLCDGDHEQRALERRRAIGEPDFRHRHAEPRRLASCARDEGRAASGLAGTVGHPSAAGVSCWRACGPASWSVRSYRASQRHATAPGFFCPRR